MTRIYCDICNKEIQPGELTAGYSTLERNYMSKDSRPTAREYVICSTCKVAFNELIAEKLKK